MRGWWALLTLMAVLCAAPAQARIYSVTPAEQDAPSDSFFTNEILYATGTNNVLEGGAQVCVVASGQGPDGTCRAAAWGRPNAIGVHGTFPPTPIEPAPLPPGTWRLLADNGDGGENVVSADTFTVTPCPPGSCSTDISDAVMAEWKQAAAEARTGTGFACLNTSIFRSAAGLSAGGALLGTTERSMIMADISDDGAELSFKRGSSLRKSVELMRAVSCGAFVMYDDIVADPPDPDYKHLSDPQTPSPLALLAPSVGTAAQTLAEIEAQGKAHRIGIERYQGAVLASDEGWGAVHAVKVGEQALQTQLLMRRVSAELDAAATAIAAGEEEGPGTLTAATTQDRGTVATVRERVRVSGFTAEETAALEAEGLTAAEIAQAREQIGAALPDATLTTPDAALHAAADHIENAACLEEADLCGFDTLGRHAAAAGSNGRTTPTITVTPVQIREGDRGSNHARVRIEASHPDLTDALSGGLELAHQTTAEGEVTVTNDWWIPAGDTRTHRSVLVDNDSDIEDDETAQITATLIGGEPSPPATVTLLDDDGPGDPPTPPRGRRGLLAMTGSTSTGPALLLSEPDSTELTPFWATGHLYSSWIPDWSPDGRWLLLQEIAPTLTALQANGEPVYRVRVTPEGVVTGERVLVHPGKPFPAYPAFSGDGRRLVMSEYRSGYQLAVVPFDPETGAVGPAHVTGEDPPLVGYWSGHGATFNPDRSRIAFAGCAPGFDPCGIFVVPVDDTGAATGPAANVRPAKPNDLMFPSWSPDGGLLAFRAYEGQAMSVRTLAVSATGQPKAAERTIYTGAYYSANGYPQWAPDSRALAFSDPVDPMMPLAAGGSVFVVDVDADGARVGQARQVGLAGASPDVLWGRLPDAAPSSPPPPAETVPPETAPPAVPIIPAPTASPVPPPPAAPVAPAALPPNRRCVSRRRFTIRLRESKEDPLLRAEVFLGRKRVRVVSGARLTAKINLRGLPKGRVTVKVVGYTKSGRVTRAQRRYRTCVPRKRR